MAFAVIVVLMRFGYVARVQWWVWLGVFVAIAVVKRQVDRFYRPTRAGSPSTCG